MPASPVRQLSLLLLLLAAPLALAESPELPPQAPKDFLAYQSKSLVRLDTAAMGVLLGWAALNITSGTTGHFTTRGDSQAFFQANAAWNVVNLAIAGISLHGLLNAQPETWDVAMRLSEGQKMQKVLLFNAGLDVGYVMLGGLLLERGLRTDSSLLRGWGRALLLQGAFLFLFDSVLFFMHWKLDNEFMLRVVPMTNGLGVELAWP
jgi:hypothetical protein